MAARDGLGFMLFPIRPNASRVSGSALQLLAYERQKLFRERLLSAETHRLPPKAAPVRPFRGYEQDIPIRMV